MSPKAWKYTLLLAIPVALLMWYGIYKLFGG